MPGSDEGELPRGVLTLEKQERLHESSDTKVQDGKVEHTNKSADPQLEPVCTETADQASSGPPGESNCTALPAPSEGASDDSDAGMHNSVSSVQMTDNGLEDAAHPDDHAPGRDAEEIAAAGCEQRPLDAPARTAAAESPLTQIVTSEMPPPAFLPRQLRMKSKLDRSFYCLQYPLFLRHLHSLPLMCGRAAHLTIIFHVFSVAFRKRRQSK